MYTQLGALGAKYGTVKESEDRSLWWLRLFHVGGILAHGVGLLLTLLLGRHAIRVPVFMTRGVNIGTDDDVRMDRQVKFGEWWYLTWIVAAFYILSLSFHVVTFLALWVWDDWMASCLKRCLAPWRWLEYFASASIMILLASLLLGIREMAVNLMLTGSMATVMVFGWLTEVHSSGLIEENAPPRQMCGWTLTRRWVPGSWVTRLQFHLFGYLPYVMVWAVVFEGYAYNYREFRVLLPDFVQYSVISTCALFTLFGLVQLVNQVHPYGPSFYWVCEATYVVLSFMAKANLGLVVLFQALVDGALFDQVLGATTSAVPVG